MKKQLTKNQQTTVLWVIGTSLLAIMTAQLSHSVYVFAKSSGGSDIPFYDYCFAIGFDLSIGVFIIAGEIKWAWASAIGMALINALYYVIAKDMVSSLAADIASAIIISLILPAIIIAYSKLIHNSMPDELPKKRPYNKLLTLENQYREDIA